MKNTLSDILEQAMRYTLNYVHTNIPGIIINFDASEKLADVQPSIKTKVLDGRVLDMPKIVRVPIIFNRSQDFSDTFPLKKGDGVLIFFSERALERWVDNGHNSEPGVSRKFDLTDAVAIPGLFATNMPFDYDSENVIRKFKNITFKMQSDGKFAFGNDSQELLAILDEFMKFMRDTTYGGNPMDAPQKTALNAIIAKLDQIRGSL
jgi:hypothetical protein